MEWRRVRAARLAVDEGGGFGFADDEGEVAAVAIERRGVDGRFEGELTGAARAETDALFGRDVAGAPHFDDVVAGREREGSRERRFADGVVVDEDVAVE